MNQVKNVLVIDDDLELCALLKEYFGTEGFGFDCAHCGQDGLDRLAEGTCDIVVLDVMLPGKDGFEVLREIRSRCDIPVIMLTAKGDHIDRVVGLEIGADDYICKPFNTRELSARIRAVLRRTDIPAENASGDAVHHMEDLEMDLNSRSIKVSGRSVPLTTVEFKLLELLLTNAGKVVSLENLSSAALGRRYNAFDRSLSVHMSNLRRKLGTYPCGSERIKTLRGEGFVYISPERKS